MSVNFSEMRARMVDGQIRTTDVTNLAILSAMGAVAREEFVPEQFRELAYIDEDIEVAPGRFLMEASPFAKMLQLADIRAGERVLDVGTGTGYSAAVLSSLAASVCALESEPALVEKARKNLAAYNNVKVVSGPLREGAEAEGPFDVIVVNGAVDVVPQALFDQLAERGRLVAVEGQGNAGVARLYLKEEGVVTGRRAFNAAVRSLPGFEKTPAFEF